MVSDEHEERKRRRTGIGGDDDGIIRLGVSGTVSQRSTPYHGPPLRPTDKDVRCIDIALDE